MAMIPTHPFNILDVTYPDTPFPLWGSLVLMGRRGSEAHGTFVPSTDPNSIDDRDLMGVCIPPARYYLGISHWQGAEAIHGCWDVVLYEFRKFVGLLMKQNPNVIGMLWLEPEDYLYLSPEGRLLLEHRHLFRHREVAAAAFEGYAYSQIRKMHGGAFRGYMGARRKELVERIGYDAKNAAHLIRLLHMGQEYQETGELRVRRTWDREMLLAIKRGDWPLQSVKDYAEERFASLRASKRESVLPETLDENAIEALVMQVLGARLAAAQGGPP